MGQHLSSPNRKKLSEHGENDLFRYGVTAMQGWRVDMEDAHIARLNVPSPGCAPHIFLSSSSSSSSSSFTSTSTSASAQSPSLSPSHFQQRQKPVAPGRRGFTPAPALSPTAFFAVFDGHGGPEVAIFCENHFLEQLIDAESYRTGHVIQALTNTFFRMDEMIQDESYWPEIESYKEVGKLKTTVLHRDHKWDRDDHERQHQHKHKYENQHENQHKTRGSQANLHHEKFSAPHGQQQHNHDTSSQTTDPNPQNIQNADHSHPILSSNNSGFNENNASQPDNQRADLFSEIHSQNNGPVPENHIESLSAQDSDPSPPGSPPLADPYVPILLPPPQPLSASTASSPDHINKTNKTEAAISTSNKNFIFNTSAQRNICQLQDHTIQSGCTAVTILIHDQQVYCANVGDSKAVLSKNGSAIPLSIEHKPNDPVEKARIEAAGGFVSNTGRVNNNLNLSRSIGDLKYKMNPYIPPYDQMISAQPEIMHIHLTKEDQFIIIACDGVWDVMTNQRAVDFVNFKLKRHVPLHIICEELVDFCCPDDPRKNHGLGTDNMTCIIIVPAREHLKF